MRDKVKKIKIVQDLLLNIMGSFILTGVSQLIVYPFLSDRLSVSHFGVILTLMGLANAIGTMFGASLNNTRLLNQYKDNSKTVGNYKYILKNTYIILITFGVISTIFFIKNISILEFFIFIMIPVFIMLRSYLNVYYRIELKYNFIFLHMAITGVGYCIGILLYNVIKLWPIIFLCGEICAFIFAYYTTNFRKEKVIKTKEYEYIKKEYIQLTLSNSIGSIMTYLDRLIINPILGASNVSIYFIASIIGKTLGIVLQPLASIILSYISKEKDVVGKRNFKIMLLMISIFGVSAYIISVLIAPSIIKVLYSDSFDLAVPYLNLANLSSIIMIMASLMQPISLKYCPLWWQMIIQGIYMCIYLILGILMMIDKELYGFCVASILANSIRLLLIIGVGYYYIFKKINFINI